MVIVAGEGSDSDGGTNEAYAHRLAEIPTRPRGGLRPGFDGRPAVVRAFQ
jgi:hypothetical protein